MDRHGRASDWGDIVQQGPELTESPRSECGTAPRATRELLTEAGQLRSLRSGGNSPLISKRGGDSPVGSDTELAFSCQGANVTPAKRAPAAHQREGGADHDEERFSDRMSTDQRYRSAQQLDPAFSHPGGGSYLCQPQMYAAPAYYYAVAPHPLPPHSYIIATSQGQPQQGSWIYAPAVLPPAPAIFSPPAASSSPIRRNFPQPPARAGPQQPSMQYAASSEDLYARQDSDDSGGFGRGDPAWAWRHAPDSGGPDCEVSHADDGSRHSSSSGATNRYHTGARLEKSHGRTPLFGERPSWWGQNEHHELTHCDIESDSGDAGTRYARPSMRAAAYPEAPGSDTEGDKRLDHYQDSQTEKPPARSVSYVVSDNDIESPVHSHDKDDHSQKRMETKEATAFTIEFTDEGSSTKVTALERAQAAERNWKDQCAERLHRNFVRRSIRKGEDPKSVNEQVKAPPKGHIDNAQQCSETNVKTYLLEKMLSSAPSSAPSPVGRCSVKTAIVAKPSNDQAASKKEVPSMDSLSVEGHWTEPSGRGRESDACSDAGTYILDRSDEGEQASALDKDCCIEWDEDGEAALQSPTDARPVVTPRYRNQAPSHSRQSNQRGDEEKQRKQLLRQLMKATTGKAEEPARSSGKPPRVQARTTAGNRASLGAGGSVTRADPGRHSTRSSSISAAGRSPNSPSIASKALHKAVSTGPSSKFNPSKGAAAKDSETMKNWLRRKEYNPMKAAAEAKKPKATSAAENGWDGQARKQTEEPAYLSNRSRSFHSGAVMSPSLSALKKHPSVNDPTARGLCYATDIGLDEDCDEYNNEEEREAVSESALLRGGAFDEASIKRLACLSQELGQRATRVLSKVHKSNSGSTDSTNAAGDRSASKEAALADMLNQLRVARRALEEVDRILPENRCQDDT